MDRVVFDKSQIAQMPAPKAMGAGIPSSSEAGTTSPLLQQDDTIPGVVDYKGRPLSRSSSGGWRSAGFIIGVEVAERFAYYGIALNLISYLTGPMAQSTADAAVNVNVWGGVAAMLPLLGAFVADSYLGRYRTIFYSSLLYVLGLGMLALSASLPSLRPAVCPANGLVESPCGSDPTMFQVTFFFAALYLVAFGQGGHKPCTQALGADQFDPLDPGESKAMSSFFNWWYFGINFGIVVALSTVTYIQDYLSWGLGFAIPCAVMAGGLLLFLLGTSTYRHTLMKGRSPFVKMAKAIINVSSSEGKDDDESHSDYGSLLHLVPIWVTCLVYGIVFPQCTTLFTKQASTLYRSIGSSFLISPASLQIIINLTVVIAVSIYDLIFVPVARSFTSIPSGITTLQRIGIGMGLSIAEMVVAAAVEARRLQVARDAGLEDEPGQTLPMSVLWLVPQYMLHGASDMFTMVGLQEFFYSEMPEELRSSGSALYLSIFGIGGFLSGILISVIDKVSKANGDSWFSTNLNRAHLDHFYLLLAGLSILSMAIYLYFAKSYVYLMKRSSSVG